MRKAQSPAEEQRRLALSEKEAIGGKSKIKFESMKKYQTLFLTLTSLSKNSTKNQHFFASSICKKSNSSVWLGLFMLKKSRSGAQAGGRHRRLH